MQMQLAGSSLSSGALFDPARLYRYQLWRIWDSSLPLLFWLLLNPSTADEVKLDPTVRRCSSWAKAWGYGGFYVGNIFAWRATDPGELYKLEDPCGLGNDNALLEMASKCGKIVCGWGNHGSFRSRGKEVQKILSQYDLWQMRANKSGNPCHPLYLPSRLVPEMLQAGSK